MVSREMAEAKREMKEAHPVGAQREWNGKQDKKNLVIIRPLSRETKLGVGTKRTNKRPVGSPGCPLLAQSHVARLMFGRVSCQTGYSEEKASGSGCPSCS